MLLEMIKLGIPSIMLQVRRRNTAVSFLRNDPRLLRQKPVRVARHLLDKTFIVVNLLLVPREMAVSEFLYTR